MSSFDIDFSNFGAVNFDKQEVRIFKISDVTIWTKYYNPKYYIGRDFGPKQGELYPRNTIIPERLKFIYDVEGTRHIVPSHHGEVFYLKQVIAIDGYDKTIESIDGSVLCFNLEKTDCIDLNDENKTITFPYRNFYSFYFNVLFEKKEGGIFINNIERDLYNFYPDNVLTAEAVALEGFEFDSWQLEQGPEIEVELLTQNPISFVGPASDIQISAKFRPDRSQRPVRYLSVFNRTKDYGLIVDPLNGAYKQYDIVEISAQPKFGYFFKEWHSTDVTIEDTSAEKITFEMPDKNVSIYASFEPYSFDLTIEDNPNGVLSGEGTYKYKEQVELTAEPVNDDFAFDYWETEILGEKLKSFNSTISLEMPAANVFAKSVFRNNIFNLKTTNYSNIEPEVKEYQYNGGSEVSLSVDSPGAGFAFSGWSSKDIKIDTPMSESITFKMPIKDVELDYSYERRFPNLIIQSADYGGYATGSGKKVSGNSVVINATFEDGFEFERWEIVNNVEIPNFKATDAISVFIMPINDVILKPVFTFITYDLVTSIIREDLSRELISKLGGPNIPYKEGPGGFINLDKNKFQARENVIITNTAQEGFIFDHYTVSYGETSYNVYDEDLVFAMPTYSVTISATFKEFLSTMTWDQVFTIAQIGSFFELKAETWSDQEIKYKIIQGDECLIGGENGNELFIGQKEDIEIEAYIEAGEIFPKEVLRKTLSPEIVARTTISIKGPTSGLKIDANRSVKGISNGQVNLPSNGYNVAGVAVTIDIYNDPSLVEYLGIDISSTQTLEDWYRLPLPDKFLKYELIPQYLSDETSDHVAVENGPSAKRLKFNTPVFPVSMTFGAKTQLSILWSADYTIYDVGDTAVTQASHNGTEEDGNIIEFTFTIADETIASLDGDIITFLAQGSTAITLDFPGNDNYSPQSITKDLIVKKDQVITWDQDLSQVLFNQFPFSLTASTDSGLPVEYELYLGALASVNGNQLILPSPGIEGNTTITAKASGDNFYKDSQDIVKQIYIWDQDKDTDGDGIPDYLDEFPNQQSDTIVWDQVLELEAGTVASLSASSNSGKFIHFEIIEGDTTDGNLNSEILSWSVLYLGPEGVHGRDLVGSEGTVLKIRAYTIADQEFFSATNTRILTVAAASDSDGDGIPDVDDPWKYQNADSITWIDDLSDIQIGMTSSFSATAESGKQIFWEIFSTTSASTLDSNSGEFVAPNDEAEIGNVINVRVYTVADENYFATENERSFTIKEIKDSDGDGIPDYLDPYPYQDPGPTITSSGYLIEDDFWYDYPRLELSEQEQYEGHYILDRVDFILKAVNPWWNNYETFNFAVAENGTEVNYRIEPPDEGIRMITNTRGEVDMFIDAEATGKKFQLIAETEETETNLAGSVSIPIAIRGYDTFTLKLTDPETGEEPTMGEYHNYLNETLVRHKNYHLEIESTRSGLQIAELTARGENPPDIELISENKWSINSKYYWSNRFDYTLETHPLYHDEAYQTPIYTFAFIKMLLENPSGDNPNYADGSFGLAFANGRASLTFYYTDSYDRNRTLQGGYGIEGSKVDIQIYSDDDAYRPITSNDDWESALSIGVDSAYSDLTSLDGITSDYNLAWGTSLSFTMQGVPPRLVLTDNLVTLRTRSQVVDVQINGGPSEAGSVKGIAYSEKYDYLDGETVTIELKLTDDNGALPQKRTLTEAPEFYYTDQSTQVSKLYTDTFGEDYITITTVDSETTRYQYTIIGDSSVTFKINEPVPRALVINASEEYSYSNQAPNNDKNGVKVYSGDSLIGTVEQGYNSSWTPATISVFSGQTISLHYEAWGFVEEPVVTTSTGEDVSSTAVSNHSSITGAYTAVKAVSNNTRQQIFEIIVPAGSDQLTVNCKLWSLFLAQGNFEQPVCLGSQHTLFHNRYGEVYACGNNNYGQLGLGSSTSNTNDPQKVPIPKPVVMVAVGDNHNTAVDINGDLWLWGRNNHGQMLLGSNRADQYTPIKYTLAESHGRVQQIQSGKNHTVIFTQDPDNPIRTWGANSNGQLGIGNTTDQGTPQELKSRYSGGSVSSTRQEFTSSIAAGGNATVFITGASNNGPAFLAGTNFCWADQSASDMLFATAVYDSSGSAELSIKTCALADEHAVFVRGTAADYSANEVWTCGKNDKGQLGLGDNTNYTSYYMRPTNIDASFLATSPKNTYILTATGGEMYGCGANNYGQLNRLNSADGGADSYNSFVQMHANENVSLHDVISSKNINGQSCVEYLNIHQFSYCKYSSYFALGSSDNQFGDPDISNTYYSSNADFIAKNGQAFNPFPIDTDPGCQ